MKRVTLDRYHSQLIDELEREHGRSMSLDGRPPDDNHRRGAELQAYVNGNLFAFHIIHEAWQSTRRDMLEKKLMESKALRRYHNQLIAELQREHARSMSLDGLPPSDNHRRGAELQAYVDGILFAAELADDLLMRLELGREGETRPSHSTSSAPTPDKPI